jgi:hypothetical protein
MRRLLVTVLVSALGLPAASFMVGGCERELEHKRSVEVKDNGTTVTREKKVTEGPDGTVKQTEEKTVNH